MNDTKIQWHSAFVSAMELELAANRAELLYEREYNLNRKPLNIDLLVIKKDPDVQIANEIGRIFRGHNILEYKSPEDHLDIDTFYKTQAYACLYKSYDGTVDARAADDITVSIIRDVKPDGLFQYFREHHFSVTNTSPGIYLVKGAALFRTQLIVSRELDKSAHVWIKALTDKMQKQDMDTLLHKIESLTLRLDRELADSVLEVCVRANRQIVDELKGDDPMCEVLLEIMEPEINKIKQSVADSVTRSVTDSVTRSNLTAAVKSFREVGISDLKIKELLMKHYCLSSKEADRYI